MSDKPDKPDSGERKREEQDTKNWCPACQGRAKKDCRICLGTGMVTQLRAAEYEHEKSQRLSGQFDAFEVILADYMRLCDTRISEIEAKLDGRRAIHAMSEASEVANTLTQAKKMQAEGQSIQKDFSRIKGFAPGHPRRTETVRTMIAYQQRFLRWYAGG